MQYPLFDQVYISEIEEQDFVEGVRNTVRRVRKSPISSDIEYQFLLDEFEEIRSQIIIKKPINQLLKWIGNKQKFAHEIVSYFPTDYGTYFEPFLGSGAVLATLAPEKACGSDAFAPLVEIWQTLHDDPETLKKWYADRWNMITSKNKRDVYEKIKASYNAHPNGADLLFLCRTCYGGVVRFRQRDGYMSTPCGVHKPMPPINFAHRVDEWKKFTSGAAFSLMDYEDAMNMAQAGDLIYCDPPYSFSQAILYGAQSFKLENLFKVI